MAERGIVLSLDEGATGATAVAVAMDGQVLGKGDAESEQHPQPSWVEQDAEEIWGAVQQTAQSAVEASGARPSDVARTNW